MQTTSQRPTIWQLVDSGSIGGIERHVALLGKVLAQRGMDAQVILMADHGDNPWLEQLRADNIPHRILDGTPTELLAALRAGRPRLIHTHGYKAGILGRIAARICAIPVVSTYHAGERGPFPVNLYQWLDEATGFLAKRIAVSRPIATRLGGSVRLIPNFVTLPESDLQAPLPRRIAFIGRLSFEKAPDLFCALARRFPEFEWHVYGDGPMRGALEAEYGRDLTFHGIVTDLSEVWPQLGLVAIPSRAEGLPLVCLEAMAAGIPVLASRVGALPDVVDHDTSGWLIEPEDLCEADTAIKTWAALTPARQSKIRQTCRDTVARDYSVDARLGDILDVYQAAGLR